MVLETQVIFFNPTLKMKLVSGGGIDPDHIGFAADHVSDELFDWP